MKIVYLLVALMSVSIVSLLIYLLCVLVTKRVNKNGKEELIRKVICNKDEECSCCSGNCEKFIEGVINNTQSIDDCPKISSQDKLELKELLNIRPEISGTHVAHVFCKGGARAVDQYGYNGPVSCDYSNKLFDGLKVCSHGCQGCMDCASVCPTGAIKKNGVGVAEVDRSLCIGCSKCVQQCPDKLIKMVDLKQNIMLSCKQAECKDAGAEVASFCGVGCTKCGECVKICPTGAIYNIDGKIMVKKDKCINCGKCVNACPSSTITYIKTDFLNF